MSCLATSGLAFRAAESLLPARFAYRKIDTIMNKNRRLMAMTARTLPSGIPKGASLVARPRSENTMTRKESPPNTARTVAISTIGS